MAAWYFDFVLFQRNMKTGQMSTGTNFTQSMRIVSSRIDIGSSLSSPSCARRVTPV